MSLITASSQLSTFSLIRTIILGNSTLSSKFKVDSFYEFEPKHKSTKFSGFPYIIVKIPETNDLQETLGNTIRHKEFSVEIVMRLDYEARDKMSSYASNLLSIIESSNSSFNAAGYELIDISLDSPPEPIIIESSTLVEGNFTLILQGEVSV